MIVGVREDTTACVYVFKVQAIKTGVMHHSRFYSRSRTLLETSVTGPVHSPVHSPESSLYREPHSCENMGYPNDINDHQERYCFIRQITLPSSMLLIPPITWAVLAELRPSAFTELTHRAKLTSQRWIRRPYMYRYYGATDWHYLINLVMPELIHGAHAQRGLCVSPLNRYSTGNIHVGQTICGDFSETAPLHRYTASCVVGYCSDIPCTFSMAEVLKRLTILG